MRKGRGGKVKRERRERGQHKGKILGQLIREKVECEQENGEGWRDLLSVFV